MGRNAEVSDLTPRPNVFNFTLAPGVQEQFPLPEPAPAPIPPKPTRAERAVESTRLRTIKLAWGLPALLASLIVAGWNLRLVTVWFHNSSEAIGAAVAALALTAVIISGKLMLIHLSDHREELVEPVLMIWRGAIMFAVLGAGASIWLSNGAGQSLASMEAELSSLYRQADAARRRGREYTQQDADRSRRIHQLQRGIDLAYERPAEARTQAAVITQQAGMAIGSAGIYALLILFAAYGWCAALEAEAAIVEPKPVAPVQILEPLPALGAPALMRPDRPLFVMANDVQAAPLQWLWPGVFEEGELAIIGGAPGAGKSTIVADVAAIVSRGGTWPDGTKSKLGAVIMFELEDRRDRVTKPRLAAAGANMNHIAFGERLDLGSELAKLDAQARGMAQAGLPPLRLVTISPMIRFFGDKIVTNRNAVRSLMEPLTEWAQQNDIAVVGITHLKPGGRTDEYVGSQAFYEAARASWSAITNEGDPQPDDKKKQRILYPTKVSHAPEEERYYRLETVRMSGGIEAARVRWERESAGQWTPSIGGKASRKRVNGTLH